MYRHILVPTDGSKISEDAASAAISLARALGAHLTALHVVSRPVEPRLVDWAHGDPEFSSKLTDTLERRGALYLEAVRETALRGGIPCDCVIAYGASASGQIVREARARGCDLIVMASHGRRGPGGLAGSETLKVVALGGIPVLAHYAAWPAADKVRPQRVA